MADVIPLKNYLPPTAVTVQKGDYAWWWAACKDDGYPIKVIGVDKENGTFSYISLQGTDTQEHTCPLSYPNMRVIAKDTVKKHIRENLSWLSPEQTWWDIICEAWVNLRESFQKRTEDTKFYHAYKKRLKHLDLL